jgi:hypothetical protein
MRDAGLECGARRGSCLSFIATSTITRFMSDDWAASAGGFPAMAEHVAFLMKDPVLFAASFHLLKQDRVSVCSREAAIEVPRGTSLKERPEPV